MEWTAPAADHDARAEDDHRQASFAVQSLQVLLGSSLGAGIQITPGEMRVERGCLGDRPGLVPRVVRVDGPGIDQGLDPSGQARLGDLPRDFDILLDVLFPCLDVRASKMEDEAAPVDGPLEIRGSGQIPGDHLDTWAS